MYFDIVHDILNVLFFKGGGTGRKAFLIWPQRGSQLQPGAQWARAPMRSAVKVGNRKVGNETGYNAIVSSIVSSIYWAYV